MQGLACLISAGGSCINTCLLQGTQGGSHEKEQMQIFLMQKKNGGNNDEERHLQSQISSDNPQMSQTTQLVRLPPVPSSGLRWGTETLW